MAFVILKFLIKFETESQGVCDMLFHNVSHVQRREWRKKPNF